MSVASLSYNKPLTRGNWASTAVWGRNDEYAPFFNERYHTNAYSVESMLSVADRNHFYTRLEWLDKQGLLVPNIFRRLGLATGPRLLQAEKMKGALNPRVVSTVLHPDPNEIDPFILWRRVGAVTFGGVRDLWVNRYARIGLGASAAISASMTARLAW